jgi:hypothetical protein
MLEIKDIKPQKATFKLEYNQKEYHLRPLSLNDRLWLEETFGQEKLNTIFTTIEMDSICRIVFHLMENEDKEEFVAQDVTIINEDGEKKKVRLGGYKLLRGMLICGISEIELMMQALLKTIGIGEKVLDKLIPKDQKKNQIKKQIGR